MSRLKEMIENATICSKKSCMLKPIAFEQKVIVDEGITIPVAIGMKKSNKPNNNYTGTAKNDPFADHRSDLFVGNLCPTHFVMLNKFCVLPKHYLIVTSEYLLQKEHLRSTDLAEFFLCLCEYDGLGFYNAGPKSGASQPHRHMQIFPFPLVDPEGPELFCEGCKFPLESLFRQAVCEGAKMVQQSMCESDNNRIPIYKVAHFRFRHGLVLVKDVFDEYMRCSSGTQAEHSDDENGAYVQCRYPEGLKQRLGSMLLSRYNALLKECSLGSTNDYSLILTREHLLIVPRSHHTYYPHRSEVDSSEFVEDPNSEVVLFGNSAIYSGFVLVKNEKSFQFLMENGYFNLLESLGFKE